MYLEMRRRRWYACHDIPAELQPVIGRRRFVQSLATSDKDEARRRAGLFESRWRGEIALARQSSPRQVERDAEFWALSYRTAPKHEKAAVRDLIHDEAEEMRQMAAIKAGVFSWNDPAYEGLPVHEDVDRFVAIATGATVRLDTHMDEYLSTLRNEAKSVDMKRSTITKFAEEFPYTGDIQRKTVQRWVDGQVKAGKALATVRRSLSELRGYWGYLQSIEMVGEDLQPFTKLSLPDTGKVTAERREAFSPADVVRLHAAAASDKPLADLIELAMWTGARIEELCSLKVEKVGEGYFDIEDAKTEAGLRRVPIHPQLAPTMARLVEASSEGYVLSGLSVTQYGDRSGALGKRFGRLKKELGFGAALVFHSIRKTVATLFEDAGVTENVAAEILGHDKPTMTYGLYSGGLSLETKAAAIKKLAYPAAK